MSDYRDLVGDLIMAARIFEYNKSDENQTRLIAAKQALNDRLERLYGAAEDALAAFKLLVAGLSHDRSVVDMIRPHIDELETVRYDYTAPIGTPTICYGMTAQGMPLAEPRREGGSGALSTGKPGPKDAPNPSPSPAAGR